MKDKEESMERQRPDDTSQRPTNEQPANEHITDHDRPTSPRQSNPLLALFWNSGEHRLRPLWRLLVFVLIFFALTILISLVIVPLVLIVVPTSRSLAYWESVQGFLPSLIITTLATVVSMVLAARFIDRRPFVGFGLRLSRGWWLDFGFGLALGAVLMTGVFLVEWAAGWITIRGLFVAPPTGAPFLLAILSPLAVFLCVGIQEEMLFRGYLLRNLAEGLNVRAIGPRRSLALAFFFSSFLFGLAHAANQNAGVSSIANITLAGVLLGVGYVLTGQLAIPIGLHITWNLFQGNVFGFPVSGMHVSEATFVAIEQRGPAVWTGGAFGPEAGLLGVISSLVGIGATLLWVRWRYGQIAFYEPLACFARRAST